MGRNVFYNAGISLYSTGVQFAALTGNSKARERHRGQKKALQKLRCTSKITESKTTVWFHCASMGEYEQGRPIMEELKKQKPDTFILVTYFSPSGYKNHKPDRVVDFYTYLPNDTPKNAKAFVQTVNPRLAVFIKYEFWKNYIDELHNSQIQLIYASAIFRKKQPFFQFYGKPLLESLKTVDYFFVQNRESVRILNAHGIEQTEVAGDVRFDRAVQTTNNLKKYPNLELSLSHSPVIIFGSAWIKEIEMYEQLLSNSALNQWKIIVAPHDISSHKIDRIKKAAKTDCQLLSGISVEQEFTAKTLIVDTIGDLKHLYQFGQIAVVGGGFNAGIHNIIEPAAFGLPVFFGPKNRKFPEAREMQFHATGFEFYDFRKLEKQMLPLLQSDSLLDETREKQMAYVKSRTGAGKKVTDYILSKLA